MITLANFSMNKRLMKTTFISSFVLFIASCSQTNPAQIKDVSDSPELISKASSDTFSEESTDYTVPPKNISSLDSTETFTSSTTTSSNGDIVQTSQERFYYQRNYDDIPKGGYQGNTYTVKRGDTLFYIAWITGNDYRSLAAKNQIPEPYELKVGQVLDVSGNGTTVVVTRRTVIQSKQNNNGNVTTTTSTPTNTTATIKNTTQIKTKTTQTNSSNQTNQTNQPIFTNTSKSIVWQWPAKGTIIERFTNASKGIDIAGKIGDKVVAAANGRVVYAGNALPGYGNLIIIKHNDDYLTAYAHNQTFLVKEQQDVKAGQQIATMGSTGTSSPRLHFEIRFKAKSVDPTLYLPKR